MLIRSFRDKETEKVASRVSSRKFQAIEKRAFMRFDRIRAATKLSDLSLPGVNLEALKGDRKGQHSIRVNDQYRICFRVVENELFDVEIVDCH
jgi:proteic killer suppression protein